MISPGGGPPQAWVVIVRDSGGLGDFERLILQQAVAVVALELMRAPGRPRDRAAARRRRPRRGAGRAAGGDRAAPPAGAVRDRRRGGGARLLPRRPGRSRSARSNALSPPTPARPWSRRTRCGGRELLCAVVDAADRDPIDVAADARQALGPERGGVRAAASRPASPERLRHSFHEARCALEATALRATAHAPEVASWRDLGAFTLLLSIQDDEALRLYCDSVLGPIEQGDERVRRRAAALAGGLHRAERAVGEAARDGLLPPPHPALPDAQGRGADRPRPLARPRPDRVLAGPASEGVGRMKIGVPTEIKADEYRVAITPAGVRELAEHGHEVLIQAGAGEGSAITDADYEAQGARSSPTPPAVFAAGRDDPPRQGAAAGGDRDAAPGPAPLHLPAPRARSRADAWALRLRRHLHRLRDGRGRPRAGCRCWRR